MLFGVIFNKSHSIQSWQAEKTFYAQVGEPHCRISEPLPENGSRGKDREEKSTWTLGSHAKKREGPSDRESGLLSSALTDVPSFSDVIRLIEMYWKMSPTPLSPCFRLVGTTSAKRKKRKGGKHETLLRFPSIPPLFPRKWRGRSREREDGILSISFLSFFLPSFLLRISVLARPIL